MTRHLFIIRFFAALVVFTGFAKIQGQVIVRPNGTNTEQAGSDSLANAGRHVKKTDPKMIRYSQSSLGIDTLYTWDSSFTLIQRYNRAIASGLPFTDLGTNAAPSRLLHANPFQQSGFNSGLNLYYFQNKRIENMQFYDAKTPFSRFNYVQGPNGVFVLNALHTHSFSPRWNFTVEFSNAQNADLYLESNQSHAHRGTMVGNTYQSKNKRYHNVIIAVWNRGIRNENFGYGDDTAFYPKTKQNIRILESYLPTNTTANSLFVSNNYLLDQKYYLDTHRNIFIFHKFNMLKERYIFEETSFNPDTQIYGLKPYFDSSNFKDSSVWGQLNNSFGLGNAPGKKSKFPLLWNVSASIQRIKYNSIYKTSPNIYFNYGLHALVFFDPYEKGKLQINAQADYYLQGYNAGDYNILAALHFWPIKKLRISAGLRSQYYTQPFYFTKFTSNYIRYFGELNKTLANELNGEIIFKSKRIQFYSQISTGYTNGMVYTDSGSTFLQTDGFAYTKIIGGFTTHFGIFYIDNKFCLQKHNKQNIMPMPKYSNTLGIYIQGKIFKGVLLARLGADFWIQGAYNGYKYNPESATFYPTKISIGNYPLVDFYVSGELKTAQIFVKLEHPNNSLINYGFNNKYNSAVNYPMSPMAIRFGFVWRFYN